MDFTEKQRVPNPQLTANPLSKAFFLWVSPLLRKGSKQTLTIDDLYDRLPEDDAGMLGDFMERLWEKEQEQAKLNGKDPSFLRVCRKFFGCRFFIFTLSILFNESLKVSQPFILRSMIRSFSESADTEAKRQEIRMRQYLYTGALIVVTFSYAIFLHHIYFGLMHLAMKGRIACNSTVFRKLFRLSKSVQSEQASIGKLVNLIASDSNRFDGCFFHVNMLFVGPIQLIILSYFLFEELGVACFAGIGIIAGILIPFQVVVGRLSAKFRSQVAARTDERGRKMDEIVQGIRIIKMYAWETPFAKVIHNLRKLEIIPIRRASYLKGVFQTFNSLGKITIPFCTFVVYVSLGNELTAEKAYFSISVFAIIIVAMAQKIPVAAAQTAELIVAIRRIQAFLVLEELPEIRKSHSKHEGFGDSGEKLPGRVTVENVTARWDDERPTLQNISLDLSGNKLVMVVGPVGSGKSSLLSLLISELSSQSGKVTVTGRVSYCEQMPWIFSGDIKQNILFGSIYDKQRYDQVIHVCGLEEDLRQLPNRDKTIVGERGVSLSGGQKARVNLARALYRKADVYVLDDFLSAIDSRVGSHVFEKCMKQYLGGSLRILVTHQIQHLPQADHIIVFDENGSIAAQGTYHELVKNKVDFVCFTLKEDNADEPKDDDGVSQNYSERYSSNAGSATRSSRASFGRRSSSSLKVKEARSISDKQDEKMLTGSVSWKTYFRYVTSGSSKIELLAIICLFFLTQGVVSFCDKWLSMWTNTVSERSLASNNGTFHAEYSEETYLSVYSICVCGVVVMLSIRAVLYFHYALSISVNIHDKMFGSLVRSPVRFFDRNPSGRIINRFQRDLNCLDEQLPPTLQDCLSIAFYITGILVVVITTNYYLAVPCVLLIFALWMIRRFYVKSARNIKRLESLTKSPVFMHLSASVQGMSTIRGLHAEQVVIDQFDSYLDINTSPTYLVMVGNRWMGASMDLFCVMFLACVALSFIIFTGDSKGGDVGMAITLTLNTLLITQWGARQSAEAENYMTSVERVFEYCALKSEAALQSKDFDSGKPWPTEGAIEFRHVSLAYDEEGSFRALKDLNFVVKGREKLGVVGRTGAGKSSLLIALFRLTEPEGSILIDGVPTKKLGLHELRKSISIIPQDPVLFSGPMRYNLDPFEEFSDADLWNALKEVNLADAVPSLDFKVSDGGGNFSIGQRQLVCLARAILRKNKILVMDEATANVDPATDSLIQQEIRAKFSDCTIITIAHRLHTVIDNDRILVMDHGQIVEFDSPANLLKNPTGQFSLLVQQAQAGATAEVNPREISSG